MTFKNHLCKRNEITEAEKKQMRAMSAQLGRAHGLPKIHKVFANISKFRPIIDTTNTLYYKIGQCLWAKMQTLTINITLLKIPLAQLIKLNLYVQKYLKLNNSLCHLILSLYAQMCLSVKLSILFYIEFVAKSY